MSRLRTLDVHCPKCGAVPSRFCTSKGAVRGRAHPERVEARRAIQKGAG